MVIAVCAAVGIRPLVQPMRSAEEGEEVEILDETADSLRLAAAGMPDAVRTARC